MDSRELVRSWLDGRASLTDCWTLRIAPRPAPTYGDKFRAAYHWIAENAILSPYADMEFGAPVCLEEGDYRIQLHDREGYSSFILLPLLTLMTSRRMVFIGAPGRGKTSVATLMALLAGYSLEEVRRSAQHGHPQLTIADLLGSPVPSELIRAKTAEDVRVSWRKWITMRVKIIDEYNRIPTKTQSALLSLLAEGYAEMFEQPVSAGNSAWFLTANDDLGGGTFPVIEALKDRIDVVVRCAPFHAQHLGALANRIESAQSAEEFVPRDLIFTEEELEAAAQGVRDVKFPPDVLDAMGFFLGQLDFCGRASDRLEFMNKDTVQLSGKRLGYVCTEDCPLDKFENLSSQSENGVSPRTYQALIHYAKALAYFRGEPAVSVEDVRQLLPWILFDKLKVNQQSGFFQKTENKVYLTDKASWLHQLFDRALQQHAAYSPVREPLLKLHAEAESGVDGLTTTQIRERLNQVQQSMTDLLRNNELNGPVHGDLLRLKHLHSRYRNA
ncbi:MAG: MoxR family ATPase, partial [Planctomycetales bacterium]